MIQWKHPKGGFPVNRLSSLTQSTRSTVQIANPENSESGLREQQISSGPRYEVRHDLYSTVFSPERIISAQGLFTDRAFMK